MLARTLPEFCRAFLATEIKHVSMVVCRVRDALFEVNRLEVSPLVAQADVYLPDNLLVNVPRDGASTTFRQCKSHNGYLSACNATSGC